MSFEKDTKPTGTLPSDRNLDAQHIESDESNKAIDLSLLNKEFITSTEEEDISEDNIMGDASERERLLPKASEKQGIIVQLVPKDRLKVVYLIFYLLGVGTLLPWNFFTIAKEYFMFKLRNVSDHNSTHHFDDPRHKTELQVMFEGYLAIAAMLPNVLFMFLNTAATKLIPMNCRMVMAATVMIVLFGVTIVLSKLNTDTWQTQFFAVTLVTVVIMNAASAVLQGGVFGLSGLFPGTYSQSVMAGMGMGGTLAAVANIGVILISENPLVSGFGYFLTAELVLVLALIGFLCLPLFKFARHYVNKREEITRSVSVSDSPIERNASTRLTESTDCSVDTPEAEMTFISNGVSLISVFKKIWVYALSVFFVFFVTLSCYPALNSAVISMQEAEHTLWTSKLFVPVTCFLLFNGGDLLGRTIAGIVQYPKHGSPWLPLLCIVRVAFIPIFMMCNVQPRPHHIPRVFNHDAFPIVFMSLFGTSNGYLGTLCMMYGPKGIPIEDAETAGAMMSFFLSLGLGLGSLFSFLLLALLITN